MNPVRDQGWETFKQIAFLNSALMNLQNRESWIKDAVNAGMLREVRAAAVRLLIIIGTITDPKRAGKEVKKL